MTSERGRRVLLLLTGTGAVLAMLDLTTVVNFAALGLIVIAASLTPPGPGGAVPAEGGWWSLLMLGAAICFIGVVVGLALDGVGGLVTVAGGVLVVVGAALGFPLGAGGRGDAGFGSA